MRLRTVLLCGLLAFGLSPTSVQASTIFTLGNNPQPNEENVLLANGTSGTTVFGSTNQTGLAVEFTSTQTLFEPVAGQARIEATDGTNQIGLTNVTIAVPSGSYGDLIFDPAIIFGTIGTPGGTLSVAVTNTLGTTSTFGYTLGNGDNFLTITTSGGDRIAATTLSYSLGAGFSDLRGIRISDASAAPVPEPATLSLLGLGLAGAGVRRWKQRIRR